MKKVQIIEILLINLENLEVILEVKEIISELDKKNLDKEILATYQKEQKLEKLECCQK